MFTAVYQSSYIYRHFAKDRQVIHVQSRTAQKAGTMAKAVLRSAGGYACGGCYVWNPLHLQYSTGRTLLIRITTGYCMGVRVKCKQHYLAQLEVTSIAFSPQPDPRPHNGDLAVNIVTIGSDRSCA